jgi:single-strand DNA-binding protein
MNICIFDGRLAHDPELTNLSNGNTVCNFTVIARSSRRTKSGDIINESAYLDCEAWDTAAKLIASTYKKGDAILVNASAKTDKWDSKVDGQKRSKIKFRVNSFQPIKYLSKTTDKVDEVVM